MKTGRCGQWGRWVARALVPLCLAAVMAMLVPAACAWADGASPAGAGARRARVDAPVAADGSALLEDVAFGLNDFARVAKGTARLTDGAPEGYRFPVEKDASIVVVRTPDGVLAHIDGATAELAAFDIGNAEHQADLIAMMCRLDEASSMGGELLEDAPGSSNAWTFTTAPVFDVGPYRYSFDARAADGSRYVTVTLAGAPEGAAGSEAARDVGVDLGDGALWCDAASLVPSGDVDVVAPPTSFDRAAEFFSHLDVRPLWVSLKTAGVALLISFVLGLAAAWRIMGTSSRMKGLLDSVFTIPMVLPPTVCGFLLLLLCGQSTGVGRWLIGHGISLVFTWEAAVISAVVVSFPLVYRTALGAFESLDANMLDAARTLGWSELRIFLRLMMPLAWPSIAAGTVLAFARAMGEFGCTLFFAGNYAGVTQTIPIAIYFEWMGGNTEVALFWVAVVIVFSFVVIWGINAYTARHQSYKGGALDRGGAPGDVFRPRRRGRGGASGRSLPARSEDVGGTVPPHGEGAFGYTAATISEPVCADGLEPSGGDAMRINRDALRELLGEGFASAPSALHDGAARDSKGDDRA